MNRCFMLLLVVPLVACGRVERPGDAAASTGSYPLWDGTKPSAQPGQVLMDLADWREDSASSGAGFHVAVLADPNAGEIVWAATIPDGQLASFRGGGTVGQIGDCCRPPPPCCRGCCRLDSVDSYLLEAARSRE